MNGFLILFVLINISSNFVFAISNNEDHDSKNSRTIIIRQPSVDEEDNVGSPVRKNYYQTPTQPTVKVTRDSDGSGGPFIGGGGFVGLPGKGVGGFNSLSGGSSASSFGHGGSVAGFEQGGNGGGFGHLGGSSFGSHGVGGTSSTGSTFGGGFGHGSGSSVGSSFNHGGIGGNSFGSGGHGGFGSNSGGSNFGYSSGSSSGFGHGGGTISGFGSSIGGHSGGSGYSGGSNFGGAGSGGGYSYSGASGGSSHGGDFSGAVGGAGYQQTPVIHKSVYVHVAPPEDDVPRQKVIVPNVAPKKNYQIVFIKAPTPPPPSVPVIPSFPAQSDKTLIYVLHPKPEEAPPIHVPAPPQSLPVKPEVYFIRYKTRTVQDGVNDAGIGHSLGGGVGVVTGGGYHRRYGRDGSELDEMLDATDTENRSVGPVVENEVPNSEYDEQRTDEHRNDSNGESAINDNNNDRYDTKKSN